MVKHKKYSSQLISCELWTVNIRFGHRYKLYTSSIKKPNGNALDLKAVGPNKFKFNSLCITLSKLYNTLADSWQKFTYLFRFDIRYSTAMPILIFQFDILVN